MKTTRLFDCRALRLFATTLLLVMVAVNAYGFSAVNDDGVTIYYSIVNSSQKTCKVTYLYYDSSSNREAYSGVVTIPETVTYNGTTYSVTAIGNAAFELCSELTSVTIPNSVTSIGEWAFIGCTKLKSIYTLNPEPPTCGSDVFGIDELFFVDKSTWILYVPTSSKEAYSTAYAWEDFRNIVGIERDVFEVGGICYNIISTTEKTCEVTYRDTNYNSYSGNVVIPETVTYNGTMYKVIAIGIRAFYECSDLTQVTIPNSVVEIDDQAFYNCSSLTGTLTIPNGVTEIGNYAFYRCSGLTGELIIPNGVTEIGSYSFYNCRGLTGELIIPNGVTEIDEYAFYYCTGLTGTLTIGNSVTSIGSYAFWFCRGLTQVTIGEGVTSIDSYAFYYCSGLTSITIPENVTKIGERAFYNCTGLKSIYTLNPEPPTCSGSLVFDNVDKSSCTLYVPIGSKEKYATADQWQDFLNIVEMDMTPVSNITADSNAEAVGYYTTDGKQMPTPQRGVNIIRYSDGTAKKVLVK